MVDMTPEQQGAICLLLLVLMILVILAVGEALNPKGTCRQCHGRGFIQSGKLESFCGKCYGKRWHK